MELTYMAKMWAGRTDGATDKIADDFNSSIRFDSRMYRQDITGSMAHASMLGAKGIIALSEAEQLIDGLQGVLDDIESGMALRKHIRIEDRANAIRYALLTAESGEILLLAGKGHENYTDLGNGKTPFSEREIVYTILNENRKGKDNVSEHL